MAFTPIKTALADPADIRIPNTEVITDRSGIQKLLSRLQVAASEFGVRTREMSLLSALAGFVRTFTADGRPVVFASNRALSERAAGMQTQALQRGINRLIELGLVKRNMSPNGKRYARRDLSGDVIEAYGIDLSPMLERAAEIETRALATEARRLRMKLIRDRISLLRNNFPENGEEHAEIRSALRRKTASEEDLVRVYSELSAQAGVPQHPVWSDIPDPSEGDEPRGQTAVAEVMIPNEPRNEAHHQSSIQSKKDSKRRPSENLMRNREEAEEDALERVTPEQVCSACPQTMTYAEKRPTTWTDLYRLATILAPMIGLQHSILMMAAESLGPKGFAVTILCMVERGESIRSPGGYLARLLRPEDQPYSPFQFLRSVDAGNAMAPRSSVDTYK